METIAEAVLGLRNAIQENKISSKKQRTASDLDSKKELFLAIQNSKGVVERVFSKLIEKKLF